MNICRVSIEGRCSSFYAEMLCVAVASTRCRRTRTGRLLRIWRNSSTGKRPCTPGPHRFPARGPLALDQIAKQVRRHCQLRERQSADSNLFDRAADARRFGVSREPDLGSAPTALAGVQHIRGQSSFGCCDLVNGAVDGDLGSRGITVNNIQPDQPIPTSIRRTESLRRIL
jgi:hypothetical protein